MAIPRLVILVALPLEARAVSRALRSGGTDDVPLHVIGLRGGRMPRIDAAEGSLVIMAGLGGALDPGLHVGDLVIDTPVTDLPPGLPWHVGPIYSADRLVSTPADKAALFRPTRALAVDMEQAAVRRALPAGTRVIGVRAISDAADMAIDPSVLTFLDPSGRPRPLLVAATLLRRPGLVRHLHQLNRNTTLALGNLGAGVAALVGRLGRGE